jgi:hypothetical protein
VSKKQSVDDEVEQERVAVFTVYLPYYGKAVQGEKIGGRLAREVQLRFGKNSYVKVKGGNSVVTPIEE